MVYQLYQPGRGDLVDDRNFATATDPLASGVLISRSLGSNAEHTRRKASRPASEILKLTPLSADDSQS